MEESYLVSIHSVQTIEGQKESLDMTAPAALEWAQDSYTITYTDAGGDLKGTVTHVQVENGRRVTVTREGDYQTNLVLEPNVRHLTHYDTPYGSFMIGVCALRVESDMKAQGGTLIFRYCTDVDMVPLGEVEFKFTVKPRPNGG